MRLRTALALCALAFVTGVVAGVNGYMGWQEVDLDDRILRFGQKLRCPEQENVFSTTFDLRTGHYTCRYYQRYFKETKR